MRREKRCYISGPVTGRERQAAIDFRSWESVLAKEKGWEVVNPVAVNSRLPGSASYEELMEMCDAMMRMCDRIFMMPGWESSKGCWHERMAANAYGMAVFECRDGIIAEGAGIDISSGGVEIRRAGDSGGAPGASETFPGAEPLSITPRMVDAHRKRFSELVDGVNRGISQAARNGQVQTCFGVDRDDPLYPEVRRVFEDKGYTVRPTGVVGGVLQTTEEIAW